MEEVQGQPEEPTSGLRPDKPKFVRYSGTGKNGVPGLPDATQLFDGVGGANSAVNSPEQTNGTIVDLSDATNVGSTSTGSGVDDVGPTPASHAYQPESASPSEDRQAAQSEGIAANRGNNRDIKRRVITGAAFGAVVGASLWLGPSASLILVLLVLVGAEGEWFAVLRHGRYQPATFLGLLGTAAAVLAGYFDGIHGLPFVVVAFVLVSMLWFLISAGRTKTTGNLAVTLLGFAWVGVLGSFAGAILDPARFPHRHGVAYLFGTLVTTIAYDTGAYLIGSRFGRRALAPSISPNKTREGLLGGTLSAIVVALVVVASVSPWTWWLALLLALIVAVAAPVGDLVESMLKRDVGVKDMGSLLPGHGGLLDRIDGMLFVLPATFCLLAVVHAH